MKKITCSLLFMFLFSSLIGQEKGHKNENKFKQLKEVFAEPNRYHNASGAPGVDYYQ